MFRFRLFANGLFSSSTGMQQVTVLSWKRRSWEKEIDLGFGIRMGLVHREDKRNIITPSYQEGTGSIMTVADHFQRAQGNSPSDFPG